MELTIPLAHFTLTPAGLPNTLLSSQALSCGSQSSRTSNNIAVGDNGIRRQPFILEVIFPSSCTTNNNNNIKIIKPMEYQPKRRYYICRRLTLLRDPKDGPSSKTNKSGSSTATNDSYNSQAVRHHITASGNKPWATLAPMQSSLRDDGTDDLVSTHCVFNGRDAYQSASLLRSFTVVGPSSPAQAVDPNSVLTDSKLRNVISQCDWETYTVMTRGIEEMDNGVEEVSGILPLPVNPSQVLHFIPPLASVPPVQPTSSINKDISTSVVLKLYFPPSFSGSESPIDCGVPTANSVTLEPIVQGGIGDYSDTCSRPLPLFNLFTGEDMAQFTPSMAISVKGSVEVTTQPPCLLPALHAQYPQDSLRCTLLGAPVLCGTYLCISRPAESPASLTSSAAFQIAQNHFWFRVVGVVAGGKSDSTSITTKLASIGTKTVVRLNEIRYITSDLSNTGHPLSARSPLIGLYLQKSCIVQFFKRAQLQQSQEQYTFESGVDGLLIFGPPKCGKDTLLKAAIAELCSSPQVQSDKGQTHHNGQSNAASAVATCNVFYILWSSGANEWGSADVSVDLLRRRLTGARKGGRSSKETVPPLSSAVIVVYMEDSVEDSFPADDEALTKLNRDRLTRFTLKLRAALPQYSTIVVVGFLTTVSNISKVHIVARKSVFREGSGVSGIIEVPYPDADMRAMLLRRVVMETLHPYDAESCVTDTKHIYDFLDNEVIQPICVKYSIRSALIGRSSADVINKGGHLALVLLQAINGVLEKEEIDKKKSRDEITIEPISSSNSSPLALPLLSQLLGDINISDSYKFPSLECRTEHCTDSSSMGSRGGGIVARLHALLPPIPLPSGTSLVGDCGDINSNAPLLHPLYHSICSTTQAAFEKFVVTPVGGGSLLGGDGSKPSRAVLWKDIGGLEETKSKLHNALIRPRLHPAAYKNFNILPPRGILLYGPPGCAKTTLIKGICSEGLYSLIYVDCASVLSSYVGASEQYLRDIFSKARSQAPCIIFFDEVESVSAKRDGTSSSEAENARLLSTLLIEMDGFTSSSSTSDDRGLSLYSHDVCFIGATNLPHLVDSALLRPGRFDYLVYVPMPCASERYSILRAILLCETEPTTPLPLESVSVNNEVSNDHHLMELARKSYNSLLSKRSADYKSIYLDRALVSHVATQLLPLIDLVCYVLPSDYSELESLALVHGQYETDTCPTTDMRGQSSSVLTSIKPFSTFDEHFPNAFREVSSSCFFDICDKLLEGFSGADVAAVVKEACVIAQRRIAVASRVITALPEGGHGNNEVKQDDLIAPFITLSDLEDAAMKLVPSIYDCDKIEEFHRSH